MGRSCPEEYPIMTSNNAKATDNSSTIADARRIELEEEFAATLTNDVPNVIRRGELLIAIKNALEHGEWHKWLAGRFALSQSTAQNYMNAARFAEKYPTVGNLKISPRLLYTLATKNRGLTPDEITAILDAAKDRWIDIGEAKKIAPALAAKPQDTGERQCAVPKLRTVEDAPSVVPEAKCLAETPAGVPRSVVAPIDDFNQAMRLILPFAERAIVDFVDTGYASATSAEDLERVGHFLQKLADAVKSAPLQEAA
jgi:hypothetical protein